jgi:eukaryotic translation initiation factor 2C
MGKVYLNLDVSATTFLTPGPLINYILANLGPKADIRDLQRGLPRSFDASRKLKGIRIEVDHMKRKQKYLIVGVSDKTAKTMTFEVEGKGKTSVANYFRSKYGITLNYPDMPLIKVGSPSKNICLRMFFFLFVFQFSSSNRALFHCSWTEIYEEAVSNSDSRNDQGNNSAS